MLINCIIKSMILKVFTLLFSWKKWRLLLTVRIVIVHRAVHRGALQQRGKERLVVIVAGVVNQFHCY